MELSRHDERASLGEPQRVFPHGVNRASGFAQRLFCIRFAVGWCSTSTDLAYGLLKECFHDCCFDSTGRIEYT